MKYVKTVIDNPTNHTDQLYTYVCDDDGVVVGNVVQVPFGRGSRMKTGYVFDVQEENVDEIPRLKKVAQISEEYSIPPDLIALCRWMKEQYLCRYMDAVRCVIPPGSPPRRSVRRDPFEDLEASPADPPPLTEEQEMALHRILPAVEERKKETFLINGVTGSGKTEIYLRVAESVLAQGRDVIVLVPEISLTPQTVSRFIGRFGKEAIAVFHSRLTKRQRYDQWIRVRNGKARIMIGVRSAVFAPFRDVGAILIDEEHELAYKSDMTPKYDAIEAALERARLTGALTILGSATPSVVSTWRARHQDFREIRLRQRYNRVPLPAVQTVDMREELKAGNRTIFSRALYQSIRENLEQKHQVILFLNRRGYASFVSCRTCGYVMKCETCGVSLTLHKSSGMAECHYCGRRVPMPGQCPSCGSPYIRHFGIGTEKVEEVTEQLFPQAAVARLDLDTAGKKGETEKILKAFRRGKTDILIGTQLVAKGLDFSNVGLVGIVAADMTLNIPDFRAPERTFQLIVQASGRAGRGEQAGSVVIQTYRPDDRTIQAAGAQDYDLFYSGEIVMRDLAGYPPFTNIIRLVFTGEQETAVVREAGIVYQRIRISGLPEKGELFPPQPAYMARVNQLYRYHIVIRSPVDRTARYRELLKEIRAARTASPQTQTTMLIEFDPYSFT